MARKQSQGILGRIDRAVGILSGVATVAAGIALWSVLLVMTVYVILRYLKIAFVFVEEWSGYLLVLMVYWACASTLRSEGHINVDVVTRLLPKRVRLWLEVATSLGALAVLGFLMDRSIYWVIYAVQETMRSDFPSLTPMWIPFSFVTVGLIFFTLATLVYLVFRILAAVRGEEEKEAKVQIVD